MEIEINQLHAEDKNCPICLEPFQSSIEHPVAGNASHPEQAVRLRCNHVYGKEVSLSRLLPTVSFRY